MDPIRALAASQLAVGLLAGAMSTVQSAGVYVYDGAQMLKPETVAAINARDAQLQARTGKAITVVTVKTTGGVPVQTAATGEARKRGLNGALIYIARDDKQLFIAYSPNTAAVFQPVLQSSIKQALHMSISKGDYDNGSITAVDAISSVIAAGASGGHGPTLPQAQGPARATSSGPLGVGWLWWVVIAVVVIFILRVLLRRPAGSR
jgi:uncharacterized membrane protein YgcG